MTAFTIRRRSFLVCSLLFLTSCTLSQLESDPDNTLDLEKLRLAITDTRSLEELQQDYEPFRATLENILAVPIEFVPVESVFEAVAALELDRVDLVWAGPSEYITIHTRTNASLLVGLSRPTTRMGICVSAHSDIDSLEDLKGKVIELGRIGLTGNHLIPVKLLLDAGLNPNIDVRIIHSSEHSLQALSTGEVDAWGRAYHRYESALEEIGASEADYPTIAEYGPFPDDVLVASNYLEPQTVEAIRSRLLERSAEIEAAIVSADGLASKFEGVRIQMVTDADYDIIRDVYRAIGQDTYSIDSYSQEIVSRVKGFKG